MSTEPIAIATARARESNPEVETLMRPPMQSTVYPPAPAPVFHDTPIWHRALLVGILGGVLALMSGSAALHATLLRLLATCASVIADYPLVGPLIFVLLAAGSAMLAFMSVSVIVPIAAFAWGAPLTILYLWLGWVLGGLFSYALGRVVGSSLLHWVSPTLSRRLEQVLGNDRSWVFALLLQLALPSELVGYALGSARYPLPAYCAALVLGEAPYALGAVLFGENLVKRNPAALVLLGVVSAGLVLVMFGLLNRRIANAAKANGRLPTDAPNL